MNKAANKAGGGVSPPLDGMPDARGRVLLGPTRMRGTRTPRGAWSLPESRMLTAADRLFGAGRVGQQQARERSVGTARAAPL